MDLSVILIVVIALAAGRADRLAGRQPRRRRRRAGDRKSLRLQLDAVIKERDDNRSAASELAHPARRPGRARALVPAAARGAARGQGEPVGAIPRDRRQVARRGAQSLPRAGRREVHPGGDAGRSAAQELSGEAPDGREGARRPLCRPARGGRAGADRAGAGPRRDPQPGQCAALVAQGARPLGRADAPQRARAGRASAPTPISAPKCRSTARTAGCGPTSSCACPAGASWSSTPNAR